MPWDPTVIGPLLEAVSRLDLADPEAARGCLAQEFPLHGPAMVALYSALDGALAEGTICNRGAPPVRYSRVCKAGEDTHGVSADVVLMGGPGPRHRHPRGEVDLCFALAGDPRFDGQPEGWVVYGPDSEHVPTVTGGTMLIVYLLPQGAIEFLP